MFVPTQPVSKIQQKLWDHYVSITSRSQLIKDFLIKGWSQESAEYFADAIKKQTKRTDG